MAFYKMLRPAHRSAIFGSAFIASTILVAGGLTTVAGAQEALPLDTVLATVNGHEITEEEVRLAGQDFAQQLQQVPPAQQRGVIVDALVDLHLLAGAAEEEGLDESDSFARRMAYQQARTLRTAYLVEIIGPQVGEEQIRAAYDARVADFQPQEERKARHILVETEEEARALIQALDDGGDFAALAQENSTGPSGPNGGDLGWFGSGRMVPAFDQAAFALEPGSYTTDPVETQFGWHVILVEETRESAPPPFQQLGPQIQQELLRDLFSSVLGDLRGSATIDYQLEELAPDSGNQ